MEAALQKCAFLAFNRVDYLAVAYGDEGLELRRHGGASSGHGPRIPIRKK